VTADRNSERSRFRLKRTIATLIGAGMLLVSPRPAHALVEISTEDLQAIARSLGFLDSLPHDGTIVVGIVYPPDAEAAAAQTAEKLNAIQGPNSTIFKAQSIPVGMLAQNQGRLDALLLEHDVCADPANAQAVTDAVHRRQVVSISSNPECLATKCCVLMVHADRKVEIVLDTALAESAGAHFSSVFTMMVKRK
jgi:hypothetical protein